MFRTNLSGDNFKEPQIKLKGNVKHFLRNKVLRDISTRKVFQCLEEHDLEHEMGCEDLHSLQLVKAISDKFLDLRLLRYGQHFTQTNILKKKTGLRQQFNKLVLFQGL